MFLTNVYINFHIQKKEGLHVNGTLPQKAAATYSPTCTFRECGTKIRTMVLRWVGQTYRFPNRAGFSQCRAPGMVFRQYPAGHLNVPSRQDVVITRAILGFLHLRHQHTEIQRHTCHRHLPDAGPTLQRFRQLTHKLLPFQQSFLSC